MVTITRTNWIDDDGSGTTGTVINNAVKTDLYNQIDAALAQVASLTGGNALTGAQSVTGSLAVTGTGAFGASLSVRNTASGATARTEIKVGNDVTATHFYVVSYASNYVQASGFDFPNSTLVYQEGAGFTFFTGNAPHRFWTNNAERMRVTAAGDLVVGTTNSLGSSLVSVASDQVVRPVAIAIGNVNASNGLYYMGFYNNALGTAGAILQTGAASVAFQTTSDARLKDDHGQATDLSALRAVVVHDFTWKADGIVDRGVFAQDAHRLYPRAISEGTDELTDSGTLAHPWMTDYSKFVSDLIVGWQQHDAELVRLRAALAAVEGH